MTPPRDEELLRCAAECETDSPGARQAGFQALESLALIPTAPFIEKSPRDSKEPTGTADIATDLFLVLQHAEAGGRTLASGLMLILSKSNEISEILGSRSKSLGATSEFSSSPPLPS